MKLAGEWIYCYHGAPDLKVEILSEPTSKPDLALKKDLHQRTGTFTHRLNVVPDLTKVW